MKTIIFGDIHGQRMWQRVVAKEKFDRVIFIGDYFDSFDVQPVEQMENFKDICAFQDANKDVIMLIGNHDFHYMPQAGGETYSGFKSAFAAQIAYLLGDRADKMQICYQDEDNVFTHAGLTKTWCNANGIGVLGNLADNINNKFKEHPQSFQFTGYDPYGDSKESGPLWVRPRSLQLDQLDGYTQIVGHTGMKNIVRSPNGLLWLIDAVAANQYLIYDDNDGFSVGHAEPLPNKPYYPHIDEYEN